MSPGDDADVADAKDGQDLRAEGASYFHDREGSRAFGVARAPQDVETSKRRRLCGASRPSPGQLFGFNPQNASHSFVL